MRLLIPVLALLLSEAAAGPGTPDEEADSSSAPPIEQDESGTSAPPAPAISTPRERLEEAVLNYQTNRHGLAMQQLAMLAINQDIESSVRQDARVYLGELLYIQGDVEGAKQMFEQVLTEDPSYQIDRFRHPPDVCGHFEYVRTYMVTLTPPTTPNMVAFPLPPVGYAPFAAYQFKHNTNKRWPMAIGQAVFGATSLTLFATMLSDRTYSEDDPDALLRLQRLRYTQFTVTTGFYGMWLWSGLDARRHWRLNLAVQPAEEGVSWMGSATLRR